MSPIIHYKSRYYTGPALKISAGVQVSEVYNYLQEQNCTAIGGECPSVGLAGGYIFAGGHSPASSLYGLAADGIVEASGIFANGSAFTASPSQNHDLYWFLSGSGAGGYFQIWPLFAPLKSESETLDLLKPFVAHVDRLKKTHPSLAYNLTTSTHPTFNTAYKALFPPIPSGTLQWSSRLIPKTVVESHKSALSSTFRSIFDAGATMVEAVMTPSFKASKPLGPKSVLPAWRTNVIDFVAGKPYNDSAPFEQMKADRQFITENWTSAFPEIGACGAGRRGILE
ncbi:MAG: hypothetical protein L6R40_005526 [Gallowayella cf. fulva]|nr:MAG: hypothetical protein L6R40_005526 [Xanthomendoza cf. fulva]